jgi:hypothetical protein
MMRVYVCTDHQTHYPVGGASVVVAEDEEQARALLYAELRTHGLRKDEPFTLQEVSLDRPHAVVLNNGDY